MCKMLLVVVFFVIVLFVYVDYQCSVMLCDDVIFSLQQVQVKGENGDLVIKLDGNLIFNGKVYVFSVVQCEQVQDYQVSLCSSLLWIDEGVCL